MNENSNDRESEEHQAEAPEALFDPGHLQALAEWVGQAIAGGVLATAVYDTLKSFRARFGRPKLDELEGEVLVAMKRLKRKPSRSNADLERQVRELFDRFR